MTALEHFLGAVYDLRWWIVAAVVLLLWFAAYDAHRRLADTEARLRRVRRDAQDLLVENSRLTRKVRILDAALQRPKARQAVGGKVVALPPRGSAQ